MLTWIDGVVRISFLIPRDDALLPTKPFALVNVIVFIMRL